MKIVITGASGYIGTQLINDLLQGEHQLLLVGRNPEKLAVRFPGCRTSCYERLNDNIAGYEAVVHLAVMNNDKKNSLDDYRITNIVLLQQVFEAARAKKIGKFIYLSSFQISNPKTPYAISKLEAEHWLSAQTGMDISIIGVPAVYSDCFRGKLFILNHLPKKMHAQILEFLRAFKPIVNINLVIENIVHSLHSDGNQSSQTCDSIAENKFYKLWQLMLNWTFILVVSMLFGWLLVLTWFLVKLSSTGPAIFAQKRVGYAENVFTCYKFRTMKKGTKEAGTHNVDATAVTAIGIFLRRTKIDELPQIWNMAKGEITLVGPRPCLPVQHKLIEVRRNRGVFSVVPGITGLAQIQGIDMRNPVSLGDVDQRYLMTRNIILDISILLSTFTGQGMRDGVQSK